ncbi:PREDICTED: complement C1q tumor necrosis factor-related protein 8 [Chrysochloris asiatica]|uniref:Complement C1q tumor necrosis factor-related protein 8 n=1 Tax=Chrysochloris asiatica TaxID=185453 RepID=A0A9B0X0M2_CHRAS|nr:PREDICTED: complement C1q tumor necrosis factor-related protein 8 [Chrysochloris asiatica]
MAVPILVFLVLVLSSEAWPGLGLSRRPCVHCCHPAWTPATAPNPYAPRRGAELPRVRANIDITILKGQKGEPGTRGHSGLSGQEGPPGLRGFQGLQGQKGQRGPPGAPCQRTYAAFSVGRHQGLHSTSRTQAVPFDTELVNLGGAFDLATGRFLCAEPGIYFLTLTVHTWNYKETYLHVMRNRQPVVVLYAQPSERSLMQSQSLLLMLAVGDTIWVRQFHRDRDNAIYGEPGDLYITFSGHLVKPDAEL